MAAHYGKTELDSVGGHKAYADVYSSIAFRYLDDSFTERTMRENQDSVLLDCVMMLGEFSSGDQVRFYCDGQLFDGIILDCSEKDYESFEKQCEFDSLVYHSYAVFWRVLNK